MNFPWIRELTIFCPWIRDREIFREPWNGKNLFRETWYSEKLTVNPWPEIFRDPWNSQNPLRETWFGKRVPKIYHFLTWIRIWNQAFINFLLGCRDVYRNMTHILKRSDTDIDTRTIWCPLVIVMLRGLGCDFNQLAFLTTPVGVQYVTGVRPGVSGVQLSGHRGALGWPWNRMGCTPINQICKIWSGWKFQS